MEPRSGPSKCDAPRLRALLALATSFVLVAPWGGGEELRFRHLTVESGLSSSWVTSILKDSHGFMWFGTEEGLNRYDGARMVVYGPRPGDTSSLPSSHVTRIFEDSRGRLWVGLDPPGVALYDRERDAFQRIPLALPPATGNGWPLRSISEGRRGQLWLGTTAGLYLLDPESLTTTLQWAGPVGSTDLQNASGVWQALEDMQGRVWLATWNGLVAFDPRTKTVTPWIDSQHRPLASHVIDLYLDAGGALWCTDDLGLARVDLQAGILTRYPRYPASANGLAGERLRLVTGDNQGHVYVATEDAGLNVLDVRTGRFTHYQPNPDDPASLVAASVYGLFYDDQGILWVGTFNGGVDFASPLQARFGLLRARRGQLSSPHVSAVLEDRRGDLWIATDGGGLNRLNRATGRFTYYRHGAPEEGGLLSDAIMALVEDRRGTIWIGTFAGGLQGLDPLTGRMQTFIHDPKDASSLGGPHVATLLEDHKGRLIVGTGGGGLQVLDASTRRFSRPLEVPTDAWVGAALEDRDGRLWVGTDQPLVLDPQGRALTHHELNAGAIRTIFIDSRANVWFGTETGGLQCLPPNATAIRRYAKRDGLPSDQVVSITEDKSGSLWLGTTKGLTRFEGAVRLPERPRFDNFDVRDGLQGEAFHRGAAIRTRAGEMFFGGERGLSSFVPGNVLLNLQPPRVVLTSVRIPGSTGAASVGASRLARAAGAHELRLSPDQTMVTFEFAALNFVLPEKNLYSYKLEGFDQDWSPAGPQPSATYTNVPAGRFVFRVRAANNDGVWNQDGVALVVDRQPRFRETAAFGVLGFGGLAALAFAAHRLRMRYHVHLKRILERRFDEAVKQIKTLSGLLPICAWCKRIRDDGGYWSQLDEYLRERSEAEVVRALCPACRERPATDTTTVEKH